MTTSMLDSLVSEMSQKFNEALDGVEAIDCNDDKTMKWRGLLNNKFAASQRRVANKPSNNKVSATAVAAEEEQELEEKKMASNNNSDAERDNRRNNNNNTEQAIVHEAVDDALNSSSLCAGGSSGSGAGDNEPVVDVLVDDGAAEAAPLDADKPKRVLRRKAPTTTTNTTMTTTVDPVASRKLATTTATIAAHQRKISKSRGGVGADDEPHLSSTVAVASSNDEAIIDATATPPSPKRKGRRPKRKADAVDDESAAKPPYPPKMAKIVDTRFEPKALRSRRSEQRSVNQLHDVAAVVNADDATAAAVSLDTRDAATPTPIPHTKVAAQEDAISKISLDAHDHAAPKNDDEPMDEHKDMIESKVEPEDNGAEIEAAAPSALDVKKQRTSIDDEEVLRKCGANEVNGTKDLNELVAMVMDGGDKRAECKVEVEKFDGIKGEPTNAAPTESLLPPPQPSSIPSTIITTALAAVDQPTQPAATPSPPLIIAHIDIKIPKKRGRKPGYKKLLNPLSAATKKSARISRDHDPDPAFVDPAAHHYNNNKHNAETAGAASAIAPQRLSRRIKPTAKILANDELRYGFELQNNARLSLSSEHLEAERSPVKDEPVLAMFKEVGGASAVADAKELPEVIKCAKVPKEKHVIASISAAAACPPRRRAPDPVEFLNSIKMERINLNRSPEDNKKLNVKQRKRLAKMKEKHFSKLGLQRTRIAATGESSRGTSDEGEEEEAEEEEFVPNQKVSVVGRPSVTLRLRQTSGGAEKGKEKSHKKASSGKDAKKRTYTIVKSSSHETSLILSTKHKAGSKAAAAASSSVRNVDDFADQPANDSAPATSTGGVAQSPTAAAAPKRAADDPNTTICLCRVSSKYYAERGPDTTHCRATDEIEGQLVGCCNEVTGSPLLNLRRASVRVCYTILCESHVQRLHAHHSCAGCGVFCTQGRFIMCARQHLFHRDCATKFILNAPFNAATASASEFVCPTLVLRCPHCGVDAPERETLITMRCRTMPVFLPYQKRPIGVGGGVGAGGSSSVAKMSIGQHTHASSSRSGGGARHFLWELEKLIPSAVMDVVLRSQEAAKVHQSGSAEEFSSKDVFRAITDDNVGRMAVIIASGFDITTPLNEFRRGTCLHLVSNFGSLAMAYLILSRAPSVDFLNRRDRELRSALMCSVAGAKNDVLRMLVQCGADVTLRGPGGMTALHLAAKTGNFTAAQIILDSYRRATSAHRFGMFVNAVDDGGWTTIVWAAEIGHSDLVEYLVQCGADLSICDAERNTVLHWAALSDDVATVRPLLLEADLNVQNVNGDTPIHIACRNSNTRMCLMFLAHGASLELQNDLGETAFDGIGDENGACARAVQFNMRLRALARFGEPLIVCQDISKGREAYPIKVIKRRKPRTPETDLDDDWAPHFIYITQSIVLQGTIQIDRRISQMRVCACVDNCTSSTCQCSEISVQNWYNAEGRLNGNFNFADPAMIFECNDVCGCNKLQCKNRVVQNGQKVALQVIECGGAKGWGVQTVGDIARGTFVAEYTGEILTDAEADRRTDDSYFFDLDASEHCIDANFYGNVSRFINHSCAPNVVPIRVYYDHQDLRFPKIAFFASRNIVADEEITFDYGDKFWLTKYKTFRCECRASECRFSERSLDKTLEKLHQRNSSANDST